MHPALVTWTSKHAYIHGVNCFKFIFWTGDLENDYCFDVTEPFDNSKHHQKHNDILFHWALHKYLHTLAIWPLVSWVMSGERFSFIMMYHLTSSYIILQNLSVFYAIAHILASSSSSAASSPYAIIHNFTPFYIILHQSHTSFYIILRTSSPLGDPWDLRGGPMRSQGMAPPGIWAWGDAPGNP